MYRAGFLFLHGAVPGVVGGQAAKLARPDAESGQMSERPSERWSEDERQRV